MRISTEASKKESIILRNLAIAGYRSFGSEPQYFPRFSKINLLIGQNNAGKSNVIKFLSEIYPAVNLTDLQLTQDMYHMPGNPPLLFGWLEMLNSEGLIEEDHPLLISFQNESGGDTSKILEIRRLLSMIFKRYKGNTNNNHFWLLCSLPNYTIHPKQTWLRAIHFLEKNELVNLFRLLTGQTYLQLPIDQPNGLFHDEHAGRNRMVQTINDEITKLLLNPCDQVETIPAIRQIVSQHTTANGFDGNGIIDRLARLQNPGPWEQNERESFENITNFFRTVVDRPDATIEIPYSRDSITVYMDGKALPIESLGSGIHEVIIIASAATVISNSIVCIEEPELHLNPILQKKLMRYLSEFTTNQYFISTHSAALMDTPDVEIYHIKLENGCSVVEHVTSDKQRSHVCEDLGYHPSDLIQSNCIIWVEGPSDRLYIKYWIEHQDNRLFEGIHYSIMFYGGKLAAHLSNSEEVDEVNDFISLCRLNRRGVIIMDSDRAKKGAKINDTKQRLQKEFDEGKGHAWITEGREIENYIPPDQLKTAIIANIPEKSTLLSGFGKYENCLKIKPNRGNERQASKIGVAKHIIEKNEPDLSIYDLQKQINKLVAFIKDSNPKV
jgi:predicted ATP-dependent endonuclease of OLD family